MMRLALALLLVLPASASSGLAQSWDARAAKKKSDTPIPRPADRAGGMKACPEYGAGFYRLGGSDTCVRISGSISTEIGTSGVRR